MKWANYLPGKFFPNGFEQAFLQLVRGKFVAGVLRMLQQKAEDFMVVTETDILTVSDGRGFIAAHAGGTYNLVAGHVQLLAATLREVRQVGEFFFFHRFSFKIRDKDSHFSLNLASECKFRL